MSATQQNDRVNVTTLEDYNAVAVDTVSKSCEILRTALVNPGRWNGRSKNWDVLVDNSSLGKSFKGAESFDTTIDARPIKATVYPTGYVQPVGISVIERAINTTPAGVTDLYNLSYTYAQNSMQTNLSSIFYSSGNGNDFDGYGNIIDDGTTTSTYAGLDFATYTTTKASVTAAAGGVLDLNTMGASDSASSIAGQSGDTTDRIMCTTTIWDLYDSLLEPTSRASYDAFGGKFVDGSAAMPKNVGPGLNLTAGATHVSYRNKQLVRDNAAPSGKMFGVNGRWWGFDSLGIPGLDSIVTQSKGVDGSLATYRTSIQFRKPMQGFNSLSEVGIFVMYGNLFCTNTNRNFLISGITTV